MVKIDVTRRGRHGMPKTNKKKNKSAGESALAVVPLSFLWILRDQPKRYVVNLISRLLYPTGGTGSDLGHSMKFKAGHRIDETRVVVF